MKHHNPKRAGILLLISVIAVFLYAGGTQDSAPDSAAITLEAGVMPILPVAQYFIIKEKGWAEEAGIRFTEKSFQSGPPMVQAVAGGELDIMFFGIGPAMVAKSKGEDRNLPGGQCSTRCSSFLAQ